MTDFSRLHTAITQGDLKVVQEIITTRPDLLNPTSEGISPVWVLLGVSSIPVYQNILKFLLNHKQFDVNQVFNGLTPLHQACIVNNIPAILILLNKNQLDVNARVSLKDNYYDGNDALSIACRSLNVKAVKWLLTHRQINVNHENVYGPLYYAYISDNDEIVNLLLRHEGIEVDLRDGASALDWALGNNQAVNFDRVKNVLAFDTAKIENSLKRNIRESCIVYSESYNAPKELRLYYLANILKSKLIKNQIENQTILPYSMPAICEVAKHYDADTSWIEKIKRDYGGSDQVFFNQLKNAISDLNERGKRLFPNQLHLFEVRNVDAPDKDCPPPDDKKSSCLQM